jgi:hypothetical protein
MKDIVFLVIFGLGFMFELFLLFLKVSEFLRFKYQE